MGILSGDQNSSDVHHEFAAIKWTLAELKVYTSGEPQGAFISRGRQRIVRSYRSRRYQVYLCGWD
jgi:hypothetical protein